MKHPSALFVVDEAFGDFVENFDSLTRLRPGNVIVLLSLTKIFAIPGLRTGCAVGDRHLIRRLLELQPPWSVNTLAQAVSAAALRDCEYVQRTRAYVTCERAKLLAELRSLPELTVYPGEANFLLARLGARRDRRSGVSGANACSRHRDPGVYYFPKSGRSLLRVAVRTREENARLVVELRSVLDTWRHAPSEITFPGPSFDAGSRALAESCRRDDVQS